MSYHKCSPPILHPRGAIPSVLHAPWSTSSTKAHHQEDRVDSNTAKTDTSPPPTTLLTRGMMCSYRERESALTESAKVLLQRARKRSYRERESALTESAKALLQRARKCSYRERKDALTESPKAILPRVSTPSKNI